MEVYEPPIRPGETYSQGYWHAVLACILYLIGSIILMINMLGYLLGHYPQHFELDDDQRTLILQTMMFFFWLAGGGAVFAKTSGINYANAVYFCDVTILTIGYGDFVPTNDLSRGLMLPYSIAGIIFLGLMINSIRKFAASMSRHNIIKKHELRVQTTTKAMSVSTDNELRAHFGLPLRRPTSPNEEPHGPTNAILHPRTSLERYGHVQIEGHTIKFSPHKPKTVTTGRGGAGRLNASILPHFVTSSPLKVLGREEEDVAKKIEKEVIGRIDRRRKVLLLKSDKDRFEEMRSIQQNTYKFRNYYQLSWSILAFSILWLAGAAVFMVAERREQDLSYFEALYFCYVSLLTIGYGDFAPRSNAGKPFFIVWSLIAIPTMTVLISNMGHTVIAAYNRGTFALADWTVMPKQGVVADFLRHHPRLKVWLVERARRKEERKRIRRGFPIANPDIPGTAEDVVEHPTLEKIASESMTESELARRLGLAIKRTATDMRESPPRRYTYEEWAEFTRLIRFTAETLKELQETEQKEGLVEWDWIGTDSPMLADEPEAEWILDRLIESLNRYMRYQARRVRLLLLIILTTLGLSSSRLFSLTILDCRHIAVWTGLISSRNSISTKFHPRRTKMASPMPLTVEAVTATKMAIVVMAKAVMSTVTELL
jgi:potassium channel subfamily K